MVNTQAELAVLAGSKLQAAMNATTEQALKELLNIIDKDVYSYNATWTNAGEVGRTKEFRESWDRTKAELVTSLSRSEVSAEIGQQIALEWHLPFSHGSVIEGEAISKENLNKIINEGLRDTGIRFPAMSARPFWDDFEKWCNANLAKIFAQECKKQGLDLTTSFSYSF